MQRRSKPTLHLLNVIILIVIGIIFHNWFNFLPISSGDLGFFLKEQIIQYFNPPFMWETFRNTGFGGDSFLHQGVYFYNLPMGVLGRYFDYGVIERIIWFYPILLVGFLSPIILARTLKVCPSQFYPLVSFIYLLNTYFFMIMGGGQLTVVQAYITIPLVLAVFIAVMHASSAYKILLISILFSLLVSFDFRFAYMFFLVAFLYAIFSCLYLTSISEFLMIGKKYILIAFSSIFVTLVTQAYWVLPFLTNFGSGTGISGNAYTSPAAAKYLSFAQFENTISLLHPYWPENVFGKVGFMKPEFLLIPILAFASLIFVTVKRKDKKETLQLKTSRDKQHYNLTIEQFNNRIVIFFALLGLIGAFLTKGANPPFGGIYLWMFTHIPGFIMFRDPTKWYTLIAISYSVLIPFTVWKIFDWIKSQPKFSIFNFQFSISSKNQIFNLQNLFLLLTTLYLLFLIHPAVLGKLGGTLKPITVPQEYIDYKNFLIHDNNFFRVLWVPTMQRFTFYSDTHPAIGGRDYFNTAEVYGAISNLQKANTKTFLQQAGVKYIVVPDDTQKEIFLKDRKYDEKQYVATIQKLEKITWLTPVYTFGKIRIFALDNSKDHFWSTSSVARIEAQYKNPTEYALTIKHAEKGDTLVFSEFYDRNWYLNDGNTIVYATPYNKYFNSFNLQKAGNYTLRVAYKPQELVAAGLAITVFSLVGTVFYLLACIIKNGRMILW